MVHPEKAAEHPVVILQKLGAGKARSHVHFPVGNDTQYREIHGAEFLQELRDKLLHLLPLLAPIPHLLCRQFFRTSSARGLETSKEEGEIVSGNLAAVLAT
ncbi:hypothetical protein [Deinococcus wulumuqiensis]|uniref:hypothetical protein n=1 Tax=Deinococcus wulumuqiensis TaxID=980427 RepID=UPI000E092024|nr:hypothetical protein [Deinococcus wulumuqiensis]